MKLNNKISWLLLIVSLIIFNGCPSEHPLEPRPDYTEPLPDGRIEYGWQISESDYSPTKKAIGFKVIVARVDERGVFDGEVEHYLQEVSTYSPRIRTLTEKINYRHGVLHGKKTYYDENGKVRREEYYENGLLKKSPPLNADLNLTTAASETDNFYYKLDITYPSIISYLQNRKPWLTYELQYRGYPPEFIMNFSAEIEYLLRNVAAIQDDFDRLFNLIAWTVGGSDSFSVYKSFYSAYSRIVPLNGQGSNNNNPLRLAVLKRHRTGNNSTFTVLQTSFPQYLLALRTLGAKISDVQVYTNRLDTYLNKFNTALNKIPITDPLFAIKVDQRLINALYILDNLYFESGNVTSALSNHATGIYNDANPLLDAARHAYFGNTFPVTVKTSGAGNVTGEGINCGTNDTDCKEYHDVNTTITLTAAPGTGARFTGWSGDCTGTALTCTLKITQARQALATFVGGGSPYNLSIRQIGDGYVKGSPSGIDCWGRCSADYAPGTVVTLTATPDDLSEFAGWGGSCSGTQSTCKLTMNGEKNVSATFRTIKPSFPLAVFRDGPGDVQDDAGSIDCGNDCTWQHPVDTQITLKAVPLSDARFVKWTGACKGTAETCVLTIKGETYVGAAFVSD